MIHLSNQSLLYSSRFWLLIWFNYKNLSLKVLHDTLKLLPYYFNLCCNRPRSFLTVFLPFIGTFDIILQNLVRNLSHALIFIDHRRQFITFCDWQMFFIHLNLLIVLFKLIEQRLFLHFYTSYKGFRFLKV